MYHHDDEKTRLRQRHARDAIALAMQARWREAADVNRAILELFPTDIDAHNRLGKALMELGEYSQAKEIYGRVLELNPGNVIAKKNLSRLSVIKDDGVLLQSSHREVPLHIFVGEPTKVGTVSLSRLAPKEVLAKMMAGDQVYLVVEDYNLVVQNEQGEYLGLVEPEHSRRLIKLIEGGNKYAAALSILGENEVKVTIKEIFQHPSQVGSPSFSPQKPDGFRPYARKSLLKYEVGDIEEMSEDEYPAVVPDGMSNDIDVADVNGFEDDIADEEV